MMEPLTKKRIIYYLSDEGEAAQEELFAEARFLREQIFGKKIFFYGFVYFSTWCRNDCNFCYYRKSNPISRYRKSQEEILQIAETLVKSGVNLIDLTMGEDPLQHDEDFYTLLHGAAQLKEELKIPIMISPGVIKPQLMDRFAALGVSWYALYQETHNRELFSRLRAWQSFDERMRAKLYAKEIGMLIEEGMLSGVGESNEDAAKSMLAMGEIGAAQMRVMSFVPQQGSPMEGKKPPDPSREMRIIALLRILYPYALIPASLDVDGLRGLESRIHAGANVVTSIIPKDSGLAGVAQSKMDVDEGGRTVEAAEHILHAMGLYRAATVEYTDYLEELRRRNRR